MVHVQYKLVQIGTNKMLRIRIYVATCQQKTFDSQIMTNDKKVKLLNLIFVNWLNKFHENNIGDLF